MSEEKVRIRELDYFRVIACFSVIMIHISAIGIVNYLPTSNHYKTIIVINRIFFYAVPAFIFLSGITSSYKPIDKDFNYFNFLKRKISKILIPYLIWNIIYYAIILIINNWSIDIVFFLEKFVTGDMYYHLYFIVIIVQLYLLTPVFNYIFEKFDKRYILIVTALITIISTVKLKFIYSDRIFLKYVFFYVLGIYAAKEYSTFVKKVKQYKWISFVFYIILTIIFSILFYYKNYTLMDYIWVPYSVVSIIFLYNISIYLKKHGTKIYEVVKRISMSSLYIYLMHPLILDVSKKIALMIGIQSITLQLIFYVVLVTASSTIISVVYTKYKEKFMNSLRKLENVN